MPTVLQFRRGTTAQNNAFTGALGELSIDTTLDAIRVHDGSTAGGFLTNAKKHSTLTLQNVIMLMLFMNQAQFSYLEAKLKLRRVPLNGIDELLVWFLLPPIV